MDSLLREATSTMTEMSKLAALPKIVQNDDEDIFGKFVSSELKNIRKASHDRFVRQTKRKIQGILMSAWDTIDSTNSIHWASPTYDISSNSNQSSLWTSSDNLDENGGTVDPLQEAIRVSQVYEAL